MADYFILFYFLYTVKILCVLYLNSVGHILTMFQGKWNQKGNHPTWIFLNPDSSLSCTPCFASNNNGRIYGYNTVIQTTGFSAYLRLLSTQYHILYVKIMRFYVCIACIWSTSWVQVGESNWTRNHRKCGHGLLNHIKMEKCFGGLINTWRLQLVI